MENVHIGTSFDEFLEEEGLKAAVEATAVERFIAYQIELETEQNVSRGDLDDLAPLT